LIEAPTGAQLLLAAAVDEERGGTEAAAAKARAARLVVELDLSPAQRAALLPPRELYLRRMALIVAAQRELLAQLQVEPPGVALRALRTATAHWLESYDASAEMEANLQVGAASRLVWGTPLVLTNLVFDAAGAAGGSAGLRAGADPPRVQCSKAFIYI
jgi:hypothetical protein